MKKRALVGRDSHLPLGPTTTTNALLQQHAAAASSDAAEAGGLHAYCDAAMLKLLVAGTVLYVLYCTSSHTYGEMNCTLAMLALRDPLSPSLSLILPSEFGYSQYVGIPVIVN